MCQVSRFDPWKDPMGVIDAYREVKAEMPEVQLALVGSMATDDPEGWEFFNSTMAYADGDPDIHILNNLNSVGAIEVNAFQSQADVVIQKSTREGFGLTVSEALWKGAPVHRRRRGRHPAPGAGRRDRLPRLLARGVRRPLAAHPARAGPRASGSGARARSTCAGTSSPRACCATGCASSGRTDEPGTPRSSSCRTAAPPRSRMASRRRGGGGLVTALTGLVQPPRRGLGGLGDERGGRGGEPPRTAASSFERGARRRPSTGSGSWRATPTPTTASTTSWPTRCCGSSSTTSGTSRTRPTSAATRWRPTSTATAR